MRRGAQMGPIVERRHDARLAVIRLEGELDISTTPGIRSLVDAEVRAGVDTVVLDMSAVTYADSSALGLIVGIDRVLGPLGGKLVLAGANRNVARVLELSGLIGLAASVTAAESLDDALSGLELPSRQESAVWTEALALSADLSSLAAMRSSVCDLIRPLAVGDAALFDIRVAVGEALANAMRHGSPRGEADEIRVEIRAYADRVAIAVTDSGGGFDGAPILTEDLYASSGRGVMFMRALMDRVDFERDSRGGTTVLLVKHLDRT